MKILVSIKRVMDYKAAIRLKSDGSGVETTNVKMSMNPFDEIAVEEAVKIKEKGLAQEIIVVSIGTDACQETLRTALAMGADKAILVQTQESVDPLSIAHLLKVLVIKEGVDLVILGKQAVDTDDNQTGQMLAGLLQWPQATFASAINFHEGGVSVTREIDGGLETLFLQLPAVITTDLRLNEPRYISLPNIIQAKRKPLDLIPADQLNVDFAPRQKLLRVELPTKQRAGIRLNDAAELISRLKQDAQVI